VSELNSTEAFMRASIEEAKLAAKNNEVPVGAVLVHRNKIIARSGNSPIEDTDPTAHAEIKVLRDGAKHLGNYRLVECDLYVTLEPCAMCAGAIASARIANLVFGAFDPKTGAAGSILNIFDVSQINHHTVVRGGFMDHECASLLKDFFRERR
jgi:tRNA(adenine34) deaminase